MPQQQSNRTKVVILYSHKDKQWLERLRIHLKPLERVGVIEIWDDTKIMPGSQWRVEIRKALDSAKAIVLLISADFLASDFIAFNELPPLLATSEEEGAVILPLVVSHSRFTRIPSLAQFQTINDPSKPLAVLTKPDRESVLVQLTEIIEDAVVRETSVQKLNKRMPVQQLNESSSEGLTSNSFEEIMRQFAQIQKQLEDLQNSRSGSSITNRRVFIVHGHDHAAMETVARFLSQLEFEPIILHEQPSEGRAIIDKFEINTDVAYAIVILTPDDMGHQANSPDQTQFRARQNVIFELGFFIAKLGRSRVCALSKGSVEIPSDYHGVVYVNMDNGHGWKMILAREMKRAGLEVDLNRAI